MNIENALKEHEDSGGYLLDLGNGSYTVCDELDAIELWGRSIEHLESLSPSFSEV